jgi:flagellar biogenesis protein FliO
MQGYLIETFVTLLGVCALALVVLWGARRLGVGRPSGPIELYGHLPLDARRAIYLVRVGAQVFIVGVADGGFTKLGVLPASEVPAAAFSGGSLSGGSFGDVLARALRRGRVAAAGENGDVPGPRAAVGETREVPESREGRT